MARTEDTAQSVIHRILVSSTIAAACVLTASMAVGWATKGKPGLWASLLAFAILVIFSLTTPVVFAILGHQHLEPKMFITIVMASWIVKIAIVFIALVFLGRCDFFDHSVFAWSMFSGAIIILVIEVVTILRSRIPLS